MFVLWEKTRRTAVATAATTSPPARGRRGPSSGEEAGGRHGTSETYRVAATTRTKTATITRTDPGERTAKPPTAVATPFPPGTRRRREDVAEDRRHRRRTSTEGRR